MDNSFTYQQPIPKQLAHKWATEQVFLTDYQILSPTTMILGAELPRSHGMYCEYPVQNRPPDMALLIEICRQACFVVAHMQFNVPLAGSLYQFLFQHLEAESGGEGSWMPGTIDFRRPSDVVIESSVEQVRRRGVKCSGLQWAFAVRQDRSVLAHVRIQQMWVERERWKEVRTALRRGRGLGPEVVIPPAPKSRLTAAEVGRINPEHIVLAEVARHTGGWTATARIDIRHPVLFDHTIDHVYAMVQLEACRQLALVVASQSCGRPASEFELSACSARFASVAEFDLSTKLLATLSTPSDESQGYRVNITVLQEQRVVSTFRVWVKPYAVESR